jgi:hypothetical protein
MIGTGDIVSKQQRTTWIRFGPVVAAVAVLAMSPARPRANQAAPRAEEIIARHVKAIGGTAAWKRLSSMQIRGVFEMPGQGISGDLEIAAARPASFLLRVNIGGLGRIETGFNGTYGWTIDPMAGPTLMAGRELQETKDDSWFDGALYEPDHVRSMTTVGSAEFDQRKAYKVQLILHSGREQFDYFDAETGLQIGSESRRETQMGVVPTVSVMRDYKSFGGVMQPTVIIQRPLGIEQVVRITSIEVDAVPPGTFDVPAVIKALIKAPGR